MQVNDSQRQSMVSGAGRKTSYAVNRVSQAEMRTSNGERRIPEAGRNFSKVWRGSKGMVNIKE